MKKCLIVALLGVFLPFCLQAATRSGGSSVQYIYLYEETTARAIDLLVLHGEFQIRVIEDDGMTKKLSYRSVATGEGQNTGLRFKVVETYVEKRLANGNKEVYDWTMNLLSPDISNHKVDVHLEFRNVKGEEVIILFLKDFYVGWGRSGNPSFWSDL